MTQIIERVARVIDPEAWSDWKHPPRGMEGFDQKYRDIAQKNRQRRSLKQAQAALEEIKPDLKKAHDLILNSPMGSHMTDEAMEILQAPLSELEKTE